jgi:hypothetical protein
MNQSVTDTHAVTLTLTGPENYGPLAIVPQLNIIPVSGL